MSPLNNSLWSSLVELRHKLHQNAELSSSERLTSQIILQWFSELRPDRTVEGLGGYGLAFEFAGESPGPTVLLRCELDALPIPETGSMDYRSIDPGVSHACGHDGHMAILAGTGALLSEHRPSSGRVILLFQPAEETGLGAAQVIADPRFQQIKPDWALALHNLPKAALGKVVFRRGTFHCASAGLVARMTGRPSHAAHPEHGIIPTLAVSELMQELTALPTQSEFGGRFSLVTVTHVQVGEVSLGVAPGAAVLMAVLRAENDGDLQALMSRAQSLVASKGEIHGLNCELRWQESFKANISDPAACEVIERAAASLGYSSEELAEPLRWCEDFAEFSCLSQAAMFGLGSGIAHPQLHNPDFDFPDQLIEKGVTMFMSILAELGTTSRRS